MRSSTHRAKLMVIFGTRPEAIKMAPVIAALRQRPHAFEVTVVVTAQHRDMLDQVLEYFGLVPEYDLDAMTPRQSFTRLTTRVLCRLEEILARERPQMVMVHGDTLTTFLAALAAFYQRIPVAHVEAGLRTGNKYAPYPEEMMRRLVACVAELNFCPTVVARANLLAEGVREEAIFVTGNTAIDAVLATARRDYQFRDRRVRQLLETGKRLILAEVHRRENFGPPLRRICRAFRLVVERAPDVSMLLSVHRNPEVMEAVAEMGQHPRITLTEPLSYPEWVNLMARAYLILSDSGGVQEEAPALGTPVLVLREVTERPEALVAGTVALVGTDTESIVAAAVRLLEDPESRRRMASAPNPYGDGRAAQRIADALEYHFGFRPRPPEPFRAPQLRSR